MKKIKGLIIIAVMLFLTGQAWGAAGTITLAGDDLIYSRALNRPAVRVLTVTFLAGSADGVIPSLTLNSSTTGIKHGDLAGWYGYKIIIDCNHAGTEPTENSEIYIYENGFDLLAAGGVDQVDNTAERQVYFNNGTDPVKQPIANTLTVTITQQAAATNSATGTVYLYFVGE